MSQNLASFRSVGGVVGTTVSGSFLYLIGLINLVALIGILRVFRQMRRGSSGALRFFLRSSPP